MCKLWFDKDIDPPYISDTDKECPAVKEFMETTDYEDFNKCRNIWLPSCLVCPRETHCYPSHRMQGVTKSN